LLFHSKEVSRRDKTPSGDILVILSLTNVKMVEITIAERHTTANRVLFPSAIVMKD
jgi:hypothetical protein